MLMNIKYISLTGADDNTPIGYLEAIQANYPTTEWAILMFPEREGANRNPSLAWREEFYKAKLTNKALHLCGTAINQLAEENVQLMKELDNYQRVQINLKPRWASDDFIKSLKVVVKKLPHIQFITQHNEDNKTFFHYWDEVENHAYLYDGSLGKGVSPESWQAPIKNKFCGYAGGLSPLNIKDNLQKIKSVIGSENVWIDMESGVRTNDNFDLNKVVDILTLVKKHS